MKKKEIYFFKEMNLVSLDCKAYCNLVTKLGPEAHYVEFRLDGKPKRWYHAFYVIGCPKTVFVLDITYDEIQAAVRKTQNQMKGK